MLKFELSLSAAPCNYPLTWIIRVLCPFTRPIAPSNSLLKNKPSMASPLSFPYPERASPPSGLLQISVSKQFDICGDIPLSLPIIFILYSPFLYHKNCRKHQPAVKSIFLHFHWAVSLAKKSQIFSRSFRSRLKLPYSVRWFFPQCYI